MTNYPNSLIKDSLFLQFYVTLKGLLKIVIEKKILPSYVVYLERLNRLLLKIEKFLLDFGNIQLGY